MPAVKSLFHNAGFDVGDETLRRWTDAFGAGQPIISKAKKTGARKKLGDEEQMGSARNEKSTGGATVGL